MAGEMDTEITIKRNANLDRLRSLVRGYIDKHQYESALFWADKVVSLSSSEVQDVYWYAQTLYLTSEYHRAAHLLTSHQLHKKYEACRYLVAKCHYECGEHQETLNILDQVDMNGFNFSSSLNSINTSSMTTSSLDASSALPMPSEKMESAINLLRGKAHEAMDNRGLAAECFREALRGDMYCFEAFESLVAHHMLTAQEEKELLESLPLSKQCPTEEEASLVKYLYENKLKKDLHQLQYDKPCDVRLPVQLDKLKENLDIAVSQAERLYYNCHFRECYKITTMVRNKDPYNSHCLPLHIAVLVELKKSNSLFFLAHKLVDLYPNRAVAWFAVGCYYLLIGKNDPARRYLSKATTLDRVFGPAWLAFGHAFAVENEHDQAMAAYFTAAQLMRGCHLPVLYIGLEYGLTNNTKLAERFFNQALQIAPDDPFVLHEMGVISFQNADYQQSEKYLKSALEKIRDVSHEVVAEKWEPLLNNLGHTCRKLRKYSEALEFHRQALILCPQNPSTLSSVGYIHSLLGNNAQAVDYFHKALGLRRDDTFSTTMLSNVIEQLMSEVSPCDGLPDEIPIFQYDGKLDLSASPKKSEDGAEKTEDDTADSSGEIVMDDASQMVYTPGTDSFVEARKLAAGDSSRTGVKATINVSMPNTDTPQANNNLATVSTSVAGRDDNNVSTVGDSSIGETSSMIIDTDTDENSFTL